MALGNGKWKRLAAASIAAKNSDEPAGAKSTLTDKKVKVGKTCRYKLELVHADGTSEWSDMKRVVSK